MPRSLRMQNVPLYLKDSLFSKILLKNRIKRHYLKDMMFRTLLKTPHSLVVLTCSASVSKMDTKYCLSIPILICMEYTLLKLTHSASLFVHSKVFALGKSTFSLILRDMVSTTNEFLTWLIGWKLLNRMETTWHSTWFLLTFCLVCCY